MLAVCTITSKCLPPDRLRQAAGELLKPALEMLQASVAMITPAAPSPPGLPPPPPLPGTSSPLTGGGVVARHAPYINPLLDRLSSILDGFAARQDVVAELLGKREGLETGRATEEMVKGREDHST